LRNFPRRTFEQSHLLVHASMQVGTPHELMHEPVNDFVRKFVGGSYGVEQTDIDLRHIVFPLKHAQDIYEETIQDTASFDEVLAALAKNERLTVEAEGEPIGNINRQAIIQYLATQVGERGQFYE